MSCKVTPNEYQKLAMRTSAFSPDNFDMDECKHHAVFGLTSEAGEVSGIFQKYFQGHIIDKNEIKKELGDVLWMVAEIATAYDMDLESIMLANIQKLKERYPDGFDEERSVHRDEFEGKD